MTGRRRLLWPLASLALFAALTVLHTWPLASAPGRLSRNDNNDTALSEWILAWDAHQIVRDPTHLFEANIFYPEHDTLAFAEHEFVQAMMGAPLLWAGASPVLVFNLLLIAGLTLTGWTTSLVVGRWTGSAMAGLLSGSLMAFNAFTLTQLPALQDQHLEFLPLALVALDRLLAAPGIKRALQLSAWFVLQALTCGYFLVFTALSLLAAGLARPEEWWGPRLRRVAPFVLLSSAVALLGIAPFMLPYIRVHRAQGLTRSLDEVAYYAAHATDYLATGGRMHFSLWSHHFYQRDALFPGILASVLASLAIVTGVAWRDARARMALAFGAVAFALSFGPGLPLYGVVYRVVPVMAGIRDASRFGQFFLAAIAILAGFGWAALLNRAGRSGFVLGLVLLAGANLEALRAPIRYRAFGGIPPIYDSLRTTGRDVVACFPFYGPDAMSGNVDCMLASTRFWQPIVNGYSGIAPASYVRAAAALDSFPEGTTLEYLRELGVTHVIVMTERMSTPRLAHLDEHPDLVLWRTDGTVRIYVLK